MWSRPRTVEQHCINARPNTQEAGVILKGGRGDDGAHGVIPDKLPGLSAVLLSPMDPDIIQKLAPPSDAPTAAPAPAAQAPAQPAGPGPTNPAAAAAAA